MKEVTYKYDPIYFTSSITAGFIGCYSTFTVMSHIKKAANLRIAFFWLVMTAISLMLFTVWSMHFLGEFAL